jgi:hypothetical protein
MTKNDIVRKLQTEQKALEVLSASQFASDMKIKLDAQLDYVVNLLEWIQQDGKV